MPSFTAMIGCKAASAEFDLDLSNPRGAPKPATEFAVPTSTANSVRFTVDAAGAASAVASSDDVAATASGSGATTAGSGAAPGPISFPAAASGGAMIDFAAISGVAGPSPPARLTPSARWMPRPPRSEAEATGGGLSGMAAPFAATAAAVATGATTGAAAWVPGGSAFAADAGTEDAVAEEAAEADVAGEGGLAELAAGEDGGIEEDVGGEDIAEEEEAEWLAAKPRQHFAVRSSRSPN